MPNKTVTYTIPEARNVTAVHIQCDGEGVVSILSGNVHVSSDDSTGTASQGGNFEFDVSALPAAVQTVITTLIDECLTKYKSDNGF